MSELHIPVSPGELLDKITILRIKSQRMRDAKKLANVQVELGLLDALWRASMYAEASVADEIAALQAVNERLWTIEDDIRDKERKQSFDGEFIRLARAVYVENDERAILKRRINERLGSSIVEEKSYAPYKA